MTNCLGSSGPKGREAPRQRRTTVSRSTQEIEAVSYLVVDRFAEYVREHLGGSGVGTPGKFGESMTCPEVTVAVLRKSRPMGWSA
jgi:hypothetical protein